MSMKHNLIKDIVTVLAILVAILVSFHLVSIGIGLLMIIGFIVPGWVILLFLIIILFKKRKKL